MAKPVLLYEGMNLVRELHRKEKITEPGTFGFRTVPDGKEKVVFEVLLDLGALYQLAKKAASNHSGKSIDGPLTIKITGRQRI